MKTLVLYISIILGAVTMCTAQQVPKTVVSEHFTNTYCSVCATRNPAFYTNLWSFPQVLHIAYHPSSPYPACPLSMHNVTENNARTNYYGLFGSTPKHVVQGVALPSSTNYGDPIIFSSVSGQTSSFSMKVSVTSAGTDSVVTTVVIKKVDASSLSVLDLYGALVEDTVFLAAANGEPRSYDVFRKAVWGTSSLSITVPATVGDSVIVTQKSALHSAWNKGRIYAVAMLQDAGKAMVQAARSSLLPTMSTPNAPMATEQVAVYPNPAFNTLSVRGNITYPCSVSIHNAIGSRVHTTTLENTNAFIDISALPKGIYMLAVEQKDGLQSHKFLKN